MVFKILTKVGLQDTPYLSYDQKAKWLVTFCEYSVLHILPFSFFFLWNLFLFSWEQERHRKDISIIQMLSIRSTFMI